MNKTIEYFYIISQKLTEKALEISGTYGWNVSERWMSMLLLFLSLGIFYLGLKIVKPLVKWILIIISIILIVGFVIPW